MKNQKTLFRLFCLLFCLVTTYSITTCAQTKSVWVVANGTFTDGTTSLDDLIVSTTCSTFSSNDYNDAVSKLTGGISSRIFKFGGGVFTMPQGYVATKVTIYGWSRRAGSTTINSITIDGVKSTTFASPYVFADCGADVAAGNRTVANCTVHTLTEISKKNPATTFSVGITAETHAFCLIELSPSGAEIPEPTLAFPGAEGHGRYTVGGRGGNVYRVTTLADNAPSEPLIEGSLRWAISQSGARTIVFDVSGTIQLKQGLGTGADYITIAGQTAPGNGICIAGFGFTVSSNNVILRYLRFRPGDDSMGEPDGLGGMDKSNIIVDHCSISWSVDEGLSVYGNRYSTIQWCMVSEALRESRHEKGTHCYGGNWGGNKASYHHNIIAHCESRTPRLGPRAGTQKNEHVDIRNNVFYNWAGNGCYGGEGMNVNLVNNYYKPGPATDQASAKVKYRIAGLGIRTKSYIETYPAFAPMLHVWGKFYIDGNTMEGNAEVTADNWTKGVYEQTTNGSGVDNTWTQTTRDTIRLATPLDAGEVTTHSAAKAYELVLAYAGCSLSRDETDARIVGDISNRKASFTGSNNKPGFINSPYDTKPANAPNDWTPWLPASGTTTVTDTDKDGMPDEWEDANGLNKNDPEDGKLVNEDGYTNVELYLNSLVSSITDNQNKDALTSVEKAVETDEIETIAYFDQDSKCIRVRSGAVISNVSIYNLQGACIKTQKCNSQQADISTGSYNSMIVIIRVKHNDGREYNAKVVIAK